MKVIKMLGILAAASFLFSFNAYAQEDNNRGESGEVVRGPYVTNGVFDNTFINLGAGVNSVLEKGFGLGKMGLATEVDLGKWFSPTIGVRAGWHGILNTSKSGELNKAPFHYIHGDLLWNVSNAIDGYKETRFWNFIPYVTGGVSLIKHHNIKEWDQEFNAGVGLLNSLRLGERVNLNLDLGMLAGRAAAYQVEAVFAAKDPARAPHGIIQQRAPAGMCLGFTKIIQSIDLRIVDSIGIIKLTQFGIALVTGHVVRVDIQFVILAIRINEIHGTFLS